ncbi:hypothetical protein [Pseudomonas laurylsulfatiphila]|uniref:hypothetical protein n=1 Tax=Pseudomonas laurylsulfatiphila TaxID=2011015 RepID=UPI003D1EBFA8|nr:hypothetical protein [Pseudomonas reinekei]MDF9902042.1 hypothetical protein [Pseudomonas reinekei]
MRDVIQFFLVSVVFLVLACASFLPVFIGVQGGIAQPFRFFDLAMCALGFISGWASYRFWLLGFHAAGRY